MSEVVGREDLHRQLRSLGTYGLQVTIAAVATYVEYTRVQEFTQPPLINVRASNLLKAMVRRSQGLHGGYSSDEQSRVIETMRSLSKLTVEEGKDRNGTGKPLGVLFDIVDTDAQVCGQKHASVSYRLGTEFWNRVRNGRDWVPSALLSLHPRNDRYAIAVGYYLRLLLHVRRNKTGQQRVRLDTIAERTNLQDFDTNKYRRCHRLMEALNKLAQAGLVPGICDHGRTRAILEPPQSRGSADVLRSYLNLHPE